MSEYFRLRKSLLQIARTDDEKERVESATDAALRLRDICGEASKNRQMCLKIARVLVRQAHTTCIVPVCPDYAHKNGKYTFGSLSDGVPLLATLHLEFLQKVQEVLPHLHAVFLTADQEAEDARLCATVGHSPASFREAVLASTNRIHELLRGQGWQATMMSSFIASLKSREEETAHWISSKKELDGRIASHTFSRSEMYYRIDPTMTYEEKRERTVRTAAQYVTLGAFAAEQEYLICNHTTVNLAWYKEAGAALIHNPVSVY